MNWNNYQDIYDLYVNGKKITRIWGKKHAIKIGEQQSGNLFEDNRVDVINIYTGEIIFSNPIRAMKGGV